MRLEFFKTQASGNDFILIDNRQNKFRNLADRWSEIARKLCPRKISVGADGILVLEESGLANVKMRIFNSDGSEAAMCGNGARCVSYFLAKEKGLNKLKFETKAGVIEAQINQEQIKMKMTSPYDLRLDFEIPLDKQTYVANYINTGVPHVVLFVEEIDKVNVSELGKEIRFHPKFQPQGTNVNFVQLVSKNMIKVRTYERGVEEETLACGTGVIAAAIITASKMLKDKKEHFAINCQTKSGETLKVCFDLTSSKASDVFLEGEAKIVYRGEVDLAVSFKP